MSHQALIQVREDIKKQISNDELVLPTLPEIALKTREIAEDANATIKDVSSVLSRDPALSTRLLQVANGPMVRSIEPITDINTAISRLGISYTTNLVISLAMKQLFQATSDLIDQQMRSCWRHSVEVACAAQVLAKHFTRLPPDQALLAGLVHRIGVLPILTYAENNTCVLQDSMSLNLAIEKLHAPLGTFVLRAWGLPDELVMVPKEYTKFNRQVSSTDLIDLVQIAVLQSYSDSEHPLSKVEREDVGAFQRLGMTPDDEVSDYDDEIDEAKSAFD